MTQDDKPRHPEGVSVLIVRDGKLLLGQRVNCSAEGLYSTPGGRIELGESEFACAARETYEETGLLLRAEELAVLGFMEHFRFGMHYFMVYLLAWKVLGQPTNREPHKCIGWDWFSRDRIPGNCTEPDHFIDEALRLAGRFFPAPDPEKEKALRLVGGNPRQ